MKRATPKARASAVVLAATLSVAALFAQDRAPRPAPGTPEQRAAQFFESIRSSPPQQLAFLRRMPKGGDLHNHLSGAIYAESYVGWAAAGGLCVAQATLVLVPPPCDAAAGRGPASAALTNSLLFRRMVDAWSMRDWQQSGQSGHDHFFDTFGKFAPATAGHLGEMLAEAVARAADGQVEYVELMVTPDAGLSSQIGQQVGWNGDASATRAALDANGIARAVEAVRSAIRDAEARRDALLACGTPRAAPGCAVTVRYVFQVLRSAALGTVFAQMVTGFTLADTPGSNVVAVNLVAPEDDPASMEHFGVEMQMLKALRPLFPHAHLTLHAGELAPGLVPPDGLDFHIRESIDVAGAERIGHGVDVMHETDAVGLLKKMAERRVMVEICLTSNDVILGVRGPDHPLRTYIKYGVPVALATDDEGVSRSEMSVEYLKAARDQDLGYVQLKTMARTSLEHAFIEGASLWRAPGRFLSVPACASDAPGASRPSTRCADFLAGSARARLQWQLERDLAAFERGY